MSVQIIALRSIAERWRSRVPRPLNVYTYVYMNVRGWPDGLPLDPTDKTSIFTRG